MTNSEKDRRDRETASLVDKLVAATQNLADSSGSMHAINHLLFGASTLAYKLGLTTEVLTHTFANCKDRALEMYETELAKDKRIN